MFDGLALWRSAYDASDLSASPWSDNGEGCLKELYVEFPSRPIIGTGAAMVGPRPAREELPKIWE